MSRHFAAKHAICASQQCPQERAATAQRLTANIKSQKYLFHRQPAIRESTFKPSLWLEFKLAKARKHFSEAEFLKAYTFKANVYCPESNGIFVNISLSRKTVWH